MSTLTVSLDQRTASCREDSSKFLIREAEIFRQRFNRSPFMIEHRLQDHPLLRLPSLVELSRRLKPESVKYNEGNLAVGDNLEKAPVNGLSIEETIRRIEQQCSWMVLKNVQNHPDYGSLLKQCLEDIRPHSEGLDPGMCDARAFIFISSPNSVTPFHIDPEINFLLQIRGSKNMSVFDPFDRQILPEQALERFSVAENLGVVKYRNDLESRAFVAKLSPGTGVHVPVTAPHWVKNGPAVSISFSITFRSPSTEKRRKLYWMNAQLRRIGIRPAPIGSSRWRDELKHGVFCTLASAKKLVAKS